MQSTNTMAIKDENLPAISIEPIDQSQTLKAIDRSPKYIPLSDIHELITGKGLTCEQAGKILGISKQAVWKRCKDNGILTQTALKKYKANRADIIANKGEQLLKSLTEDEIKKIPPGSRVTAFGILYDKERLERD